MNLLIVQLFLSIMSSIKNQRVVLSIKVFVLSFILGVSVYYNGMIGTLNMIGTALPPDFH